MKETILHMQTGVKARWCTGVKSTEYIYSMALALAASETERVPISPFRVSDGDWLNVLAGCMR